MSVVITAFERSTGGGKGLARDARVRCAREEVGQAYQVRLGSFREMKEPAHLAIHPFGQIPTFEQGDLAPFETGAIVLHVAVELANAKLLEGDTPCTPERLPVARGEARPAYRRAFAAQQTVDG